MSNDVTRAAPSISATALLRVVLQIFLGAFDVWPALAAISVLGIIITAALFLLALQRAFMGDTPEPLRRLPDLHVRELIAVAPLVALFVALGVYPRPALDLINSAGWLLGG